MINGKSVLAIIPARSGSKELPGKNIKSLLDKPLLAWPIRASQKSKFVDRVIVSTEDAKIADIAKQYGAETPFLRPDKLATDTATTFSVLEHAMKWLLVHENSNYDYMVLLQPTSPLTEATDIDTALIELDTKSITADSIVGVAQVKSAHPNHDAFINELGLLEPYIKGAFDTLELRRQELGELYFFNGGLYISKCNVLLDKKSFYHDKTLPYMMPKWKSIDIDDIVDFYCTEAIVSKSNIDGLDIFR